jgi:hypothetical protein
MGTSTIRKRDAHVRDTTAGPPPGDPEPGREVRAPAGRRARFDLHAVWARAETTLNLAHRMDREARRYRHTAQHLGSILRAARSRRRSAWARRAGVSPEA